MLCLNVIKVKKKLKNKNNNNVRITTALEAKVSKKRLSVGVSSKNLERIYIVYDCVDLTKTLPMLPSLQ